MEETRLQSSTELFATNGVGSEVNGKSVPDRRSGDTDATRSVAFSSASRNDEVVVARRAQANCRHRTADIAEVRGAGATDAVERNDRDFVFNALCCRQPV